MESSNTAGLCCCKPRKCSLHKTPLQVEYHLITTSEHLQDQETSEHQDDALAVLADNTEVEEESAFYADEELDAPKLRRQQLHDEFVYQDTHEVEQAPLEDCEDFDFDFEDEDAYFEDDQLAAGGEPEKAEVVEEKDDFERDRMAPSVELKSEETQQHAQVTAGA